MTYAKAGVDIDGKSNAISHLVQTLEFRRKGKGRMLDIGGHFTGLIDFGDYALSLCTDTVGTKIIVANEMKKWDTIGIDCMAMNVNDMICVGAEPLAFVDFISIDRPDSDRTRQIGVGLNEGARMSNVSIIGGEIAVVPELVNGADLGGTCLGMVKKKDIVTGSKIKVGDAVIGLESSGIHSNGLTLARKIVNLAGLSWKARPRELDRSIGEELLTPTKLYVKPVLEMLKKCRVHGMANITGGGLRNLVRLKDGVEFRFEEPLEPQAIFDWMQKEGRVTDEEMYQIFNMGMGFAVVLPEGEVPKAIRILRANGATAKRVGGVAKGRGVTVPHMGLSYKRY
ncbi:MAG: phosphoribosylformylglycinamidine cyclo-ligase [Euryarchaeota archaeon]|nr:phosphoribosylformylglycinamidine cyclo-ligase [Euryarchaeota archaeon]